MSACFWRIRYDCTGVLSGPKEPHPAAASGTGRGIAQGIGRLRSDMALVQAVRSLGGRSCKGGLIPLKLNAESKDRAFTATCTEDFAEKSGVMAVSAEQAQSQAVPPFSGSPGNVQDMEAV